MMLTSSFGSMITLVFILLRIPQSSTINLMDNQDGLLHIGVRACAFACACVFNDDGGADIITSMLMVFFSIAA